MTKTEMRDSAVRVARGARYMDANHSGWERRIDLSVLNIADPAVCVCGQVLNVNGATRGWTRVDDELTAIQEDSYEYGFCDNMDGDAWVMLIKERFDSGLLSDLV